MAVAPQTAAQPLFIAGPTAVGKSEVALQLAERLVGEIISVDSMQVYRGLDIGTAKPSAPERARAPHHLLDVADLKETFDAAKFRELAAASVKEIQSRGRLPIFCGGTGLYFKAYIEGLGDAPPADAALRAELETAPLDQLLDELARHDPQTFNQIDRRNPRRVIRAVEVIRLTTKPYSAQRVAWSADSSQQRLAFYVLNRAKPDLDTRINARVDAMFAHGLVAETEALLAQGLAQNRTAMQAIGYRQVTEHLQGERSLGETIDLVKAKTRQYAKRQLTWFRRHAAATWIEIGSGEDPLQVTARILTGFSP